MKIFRAFLLVGLLALGAVAVYATYTKQNSRVTRLQFEVTYASGTIAAVQAKAFLVSAFVNDANAADVVDAPTWSEVSFNLLDPAISATTITAGGKTVTYAQLAALLRQAALDRANAAGIQ